MRKLVFIFGLLFTVSAHASVTLTNPYVISTGPTTTVSAAYLTTCEQQRLDETNTLVITYCYGTVTKTGSQDTSFAYAAGFPKIIGTLNLNSGVYTLVENGQVLYSTTLSPSNIAGAITTYASTWAAIRNAADGYLVTVLSSFGAQNDTW